MKQPSISWILLGGLFFLATSTHAPAAEEKSFEELVRTISELKPKYMEQSKRATAIRALARKNSLPAANVLVTLLADPYVHIREVVVTQFGKMKDPEIAGYLARRGFADRNPDIRRNTAEALGKLGEKIAADVSDRKPDVRRRAAEILGLLREGIAVDRLGKALGDRDPRVGVEAARALARIGGPAAADLIRKRLSGLRGAVKGEALRALGTLKQAPDEKNLDGLFKQSKWRVRVGFLDGLAAARHDRAMEFAVKGLGDKAYQVRIAALESLVRITLDRGGDAVREALRGIETGLKDSEWQVRAAAVHSTVDLWHVGAVPLLVEALKREEEGGGGRLLIDLGRMLQLFTGKTIGFDGDLWASWWSAQKGKFQLGKKPKRNRYGVIMDLVDPPKDEKTVVTFYNLPVVSKRVAFVFDFSGSMRNRSSDKEGARPKIDIAKEKTKETLDKFKQNQWFNFIIYRYYSTFPPETLIERAFPAKLMPADKIRKDQAKEFLENLTPRGWGCFLEAIHAAMQIREVDTIYYLSDGVPSRGRYVLKTGIMDRLREVNRFRRVMIHTILTGEKGADERFMRDLAGITWGLTTKG